jgi:HSP20 family protein
MAVTQYRPTSDPFGMLFENFLAPHAGSNRMSHLLRAPEADVVERENEIRVMIEIPGMKADDIEIDLENNVLTVNGEKREERTEGDERNTWHLSERRYGKFSRSFLLPRDVEPDGIQARFEDGVLNITIPKSERVRRRRIEVKSSGNGQTRKVGSGDSSKKS